MKYEMTELTPREMESIHGGDSASWLAVGGIAIAVSIGILCVALVAPVAATVVVVAGVTGVAGDVAVGYGMATMN
jgi:hypothetical protein